MKINNTLEKCFLQNDDDRSRLFARFNPSQIAWSKSVPWTEHAQIKGRDTYLEFTKAKPATLTCELFFDFYEEKLDVYHEAIGYLESLVTVEKHAKGEMRPPIVVFGWGKQFRKFRGVMSSLDVKYTMFLPTGRPVRATATVKLTQCGRTSARFRQGKRVDLTKRPRAPKPGERGYDPRR